VEDLAREIPNGNKDHKSGEINPDGVEYGVFKLDGEFPS
jgi:hypothetical protein